MLYSESRKNSTQGHIALILLFGIMMLGTLSSCLRYNVSPEFEALSNHRQQLLSDSLVEARQWLQNYIVSHRDPLTTDKNVSHYYKNGGAWFWISEEGAYSPHMKHNMFCSIFFFKMIFFNY